MFFPPHFRRLALSAAFCAACTLSATAAKSTSSDDDDSPAPKRSTTKKATATPAPTAHRSPKSAAKTDDESAADATPAKSPMAGQIPADGKKPLATPSAKRKAAADDDDAPAPARSPHEEKGKAVGSGDAPEAVIPPAPTNVAPTASLASAELVEFAAQPENVRKLIEDGLALTKLNLTYKFGSDDPAAGGMDCSGTVSYLLRQNGFKDVPRDASGQYVWARKNGKFFAVNSKKAGGFEFNELLPGDLMFWSGTYQADRDPPVTHSMIYLGTEKGRHQQVMFGSSDGRTYDGKQRFGVSVFDFRMPKAEAPTTGGRQAVFLGYARIPGLREPAAPEVKEQEKDEEKAATKKSGGTQSEGKTTPKKSTRRQSGQ